jgi:hypothetical protein
MKNRFSKFAALSNATCLYRYTAGRERWFNRFVIEESKDENKNTMIYMLSNPAPGVADDAPAAEAHALPAFPNTPDPARLAAALDAGDFSALADTGAAVAEVLTKV